MTESTSNTPEVTRRGFVTGTCLLAAGAVAPTGGRERTEGRETPIESKVEQLVRESLDEHDIPGASVAVVRDGSVALAEGYGVAERGTDRSVEATTPFRVGSVSKPVVGTAIAGLVARGELDLETPVSTYVDDGLRSWDEPVTLRHLLTHTAGFETTNLGMWYPTPADTDPLPDHLDEAMPAQVRSPGERGSYSNHGVALAGQALASTAGAPFAEAMDATLLEPAGMEKSSFEQPLPESIRERHAAGHDGTLTDSPLSGLGMAPAGALSTTAADVARFLQLHLSGGALDGEQVLPEAAVETSQRQQFTHHDRLAGMALGFVEEFRGDVRILRHSGGTPDFLSTLLVVPERGFGLFLSFNSVNASDPVETIPETVLDELLPDPTPDGLEPAGEPTRAGALTGTYRILRTPETTHDTFPFTLLNAPSVDVSVDDDGALRLDELDGRWVEREPLLFQNVETGERLAFEEDGGDRFLYVGGTPSAFERIRWYERADVHGVVAVLALVGLLTGLFRWVPSREDESWREWLASTRDDPRRLAELAAFGGSLAFVGFVGVTAVYFVSSPRAFLVEPAVLYDAAFLLPVTGAVASVAAVAVAALGWRRGYWDIRRRVHYSLVAAALLGMAVFLWHWNLLLPP
jgi:CubicO group peptidase (beta-lactamase class C family)